MDLFFLLDSPALLFVTLAIAALGILWLYVTLGGKQEQPNLSALYEPVAPVASKAATNKKTNKAKPKKQGDTSPRAAPKLRETQSEPPSTNVPAKKQKTGVETVKAPQGPKSKGRKSQNAPKPVAEEAEMEVLEGNEGEWQTQLSRQQKKQAALRQKQQATTESPVPPEPVAQENKGEEEESKASANSEKTSYSKSGRRGKNKKQREKETTKTSEPTKDTPVAPVVEQTATPPTSEGGQSGEERIAPPPQASKGQEVTEVEKALREAAESSSSPEHKNEGEFAEVKYKKQKKSKRKDTTSKKSSSPELSTKDHEDDWVEIIKK